MTDNDQRYIVRQRKIAPTDKDLAVFARVMRSKDGVFEGVSFIRNQDKASILTLADAQQAVAWVKAKKPLVNLYETTIVSSDQSS
jgi:hypothetical protein